MLSSLKHQVCETSNALDARNFKPTEQKPILIIDVMYVQLCKFYVVK